MNGEDRISRLFDVTADGVGVAAQRCRVSAIPFNCIWPGHQRPLEQTEEAAFVSVQTKDAARITVKPNRPFSRCVIRPLSKGVRFRVEDGVISFEAGVGQYTVELDGCHNALHLFVDPEKDFSAYRERADLYFGPGVHELGRCPLKSGMTVFIDRGAVVLGSFYGQGLNHINLVGYGVISGENDIRTQPDHMVPAYGMGPEWPTGALQLFESRNVFIEGLTFMDSAFWTMTFCACENVVMDNIKHVGMWRYNSDGMDIICSKNFIVRNSFFRNFDDVIVPNGRTRWAHIATENLLVDNCVCWCDWGRTLEVGVITCVNEMRSLVFRNCDLIHNMHAAIDIRDSKWADIYDIVWDDIRAEYSRDCLTPVYQENDAMRYEPVEGFLPPLVHIDTAISGTGFPPDRDRQIHEITVRGVSVFADEGLAMPPVEILGVDRAHALRAIRLERFSFNGRPIKTARELNATFDEFSGDVYLDGERIH